MENILKVIDEICNAECSKDQMRKFASFDLESVAKQDFFDRYYSIDYILNAIDKYKNGEISAEYLSLWATCYNHIIMAYTDYFDRVRFDYVDTVIDDISESLDSLSFFDEFLHDFKDEADIDSYRNGFIEMDNYYKEIDQYKVYYSDNDDPAYHDFIMCVINSAKKEFVICESSSFIDIVLNPDDKPETQIQSDMTYIKKTEFDKLIKDLSEQGYDKTDNTVVNDD